MRTKTIPPLFSAWGHFLETVGRIIINHYYDVRFLDGYTREAYSVFSSTPDGISHIDGVIGVLEIKFPVTRKIMSTDEIVYWRYKEQVELQRAVFSAKWSIYAEFQCVPFGIGHFLANSDFSYCEWYPVNRKVTKKMYATFIWWPNVTKKSQTILLNNDELMICDNCKGNCQKISIENIHKEASDEFIDLTYATRDEAIEFMIHCACPMFNVYSKKNFGKAKKDLQFAEKIGGAILFFIIDDFNAVKQVYPLNSSMPIIIMKKAKMVTELVSLYVARNGQTKDQKKKKNDAAILGNFVEEFFKSKATNHTHSYTELDEVI